VTTPDHSCGNGYADSRRSDEYEFRRLLEPAGRSGMKYAYECPYQDCGFTLEANDDTALERRVARHDARQHGRKFDRARFEDRLEVS